MKLDLKVETRLDPGLGHVYDVTRAWGRGRRLLRGGFTSHKSADRYMMDVFYGRAPKA